MLLNLNLSLYLLPLHQIATNGELFFRAIVKMEISRFIFQTVSGKFCW
jgi:hypothetical protein